MWCGYYDGNEKSKRVQEKCGFVYHHTVKDKPCSLMGDIRTEHFTYLSKEEWETGLIVRSLAEREKSVACDLAWKVFQKYEAPEYDKEGIDEFRATLDNPDFIGKMSFYGAYEEGTLVGMLAMRSPQHISLFFVSEDYHRRGIGRRLFQRMKADYSKKEFTVNSSPFAITVYKHLGFVPTDTQQLTNGIMYTPMKYEE